MLTPEEADAVLFLFWYPEPLSNTLTESIIDFLLTDFKECFPTPKSVKYTVLIPEIASLCLGCNLTVRLSIVETKYSALVTIPTIPSWLLLL